MYLRKILLIDLKLPIWVCGVILYCSSLLVTGYYVYDFNHPFQLSLVHLLNDPSLYPDDPLVSTLPYYASLLWRVVALCSRVVPLEPLLLTLFLLERMLVIYASGYLAHTLAPRSRLAVIGAMALFALAPRPVLGSGTLVPPYFEQTGLSIPFFLLAMASFYRHRPTLWAIWLSIGFNLNSMYGTYAITYFVAQFLLDSGYWRQWKKWILAISLFALLASPAILITASAFGRTESDRDLWLMASQIRLPHHLYPLTWSKGAFIKFGVLLFLCLALLYQNRKEMERLLKHGLAWTGVSVAWLLYAFTAAYVAKSPSMLVMHPARGTDLWYCLAGIMLVSVCAMGVEKGNEYRALSVAAFIASVLFWYWHPIPSLVIITGLIALAYRPIWEYAFLKGNSSRLALLLTLLVFLLGGQALGNRLASIGTAFIVQPDLSMREVAHWAKEATPKDATFLVNPLWKEFRALSKRPVFVTWKDGSAILWDRTFVKEWIGRLGEIGVDIRQQTLPNEDIIARLDDVYRRLDDHDVETLKARFPINYWVVPLDHPSSFSIGFQNQCYKVLNLERVDFLD